MQTNPDLFGLRGGLGYLGDLNQGALASSAGNIVGGVASATGIFGTVAAGSALIPVIGTAIAAVGTVVGLFLNRASQRQKVATTQVVNEAEPLLQQNLSAWQHSGKTQSEQALSLSYFDKVWQAVYQRCSDPAMGDAGQRCIHEREAGGAAPWCPSSTGCDWFTLYRNPIANDPDVIPDPGTVGGGSVAGSISSLLNFAGGGAGSGGGLGVVLLPLLLIAGAFYLGGD